MGPGLPPHCCAHPGAPARSIWGAEGLSRLSPGASPGLCPEATSPQTQGRWLGRARGLPVSCGHRAHPRRLLTHTSAPPCSPLSPRHPHLPWWPPQGALLLARKSREPGGALWQAAGSPCAGGAGTWGVQLPWGSLPCSGHRGQVSGRTAAPRPAPGASPSSHQPSLPGCSFKARRTV